MKFFIISLLPIFVLTGLGISIVLTTDLITQAEMQSRYEMEISNEIDEQYGEEDFVYNIEGYYTVE